MESRRSLFTAEIRWQGFDMNPFEPEEALLPSPDEFRTSSGRPSDEVQAEFVGALLVAVIKC